MFITERAQPGMPEREGEPDEGPRLTNCLDALDREGVEADERERRPAPPEDDPIRLYFGETGKVQIFTLRAAP